MTTKQIYIISAIIVLGIVTAFALVPSGQHGDGSLSEASKNVYTTGTMTVTSDAFANGSKIPLHYTCDEVGARPALLISGVPLEAQSLALIVNDPDAPSGNFVHWVLYNMAPPHSTGSGQVTLSISSDVLPQNAVVGLNSVGKREWVAPCPPSGLHHYHFTVFALDNMITTNHVLDESELRTAMQGHIMTQAELIGVYK